MKNEKKGGFIVSAELVLIATIMVLGLLVGMVAVRDAMIGELHDVGTAFGELNQGYNFRGTRDARETQNGNDLVYSYGSAWTDWRDDGDRFQRYSVRVGPVREDEDRAGRGPQ